MDVGGISTEMDTGSDTSSCVSAISTDDEADGPGAFREDREMSSLAELFWRLGVWDDSLRVVLVVFCREPASLEESGILRIAFVRRASGFTECPLVPFLLGCSECPFARRFFRFQCLRRSFPT